MAKTLCTGSVVNDVDLKGPEGYQSFRATKLAKPFWSLSSSFPSCTLSSPPVTPSFSLPPIHTNNFMGAMAPVGEE